MENELNQDQTSRAAAMKVAAPGPFPVSFDIPPPAVVKTKKGRIAKTSQEKPQTDTFVVYVDGSSLGNPGPSGWCALVVFPSGRRETLRDGYSHSTNNRMELHAAIAALSALPADASGVIRSDAEYVVKGVNEWRVRWEANGWRNSQKKPVENADLWQRLFRLRDERPGIRFEWVKGHAADAGNAYVDRIARAAAEEQRQALIAEKAQAAA